MQLIDPRFSVMHWPDGPNRQKDLPSQIDASDDIEAVNTWLGEFKDSPHTFRAYRKEAERFINWSLIEAKKSLSAIRKSDLDAYQHFLGDPPPSWCSPRNTRRGSAAWRPFEGKLSKISQAHAMGVITAMLDYLVGVNYLVSNPARASRGRRRGILKGARKIERAVSPDTIRAVLSALREAGNTQASRTAKNSAIRALFIVRFLVNTGLRRAELAQARMRDFLTIESAQGRGLFLEVVGKGGKRRYVVINAAALDALGVYRNHYGLPQEPEPGDPCPVLLSVSGRNSITHECLSEGVVYAASKSAMRSAMALMPDVDPQTCKSLGRVSPHWFRHAYASACLAMGYSINAVQDQLGHESITTTAGYQHTESVARYQELSGLSL